MEKKQTEKSKAEVSEKKKPEKSEAELYREERKKRIAKATKKNERKSPQAAKIGRVFGRVVGIVIVVAVCLGILYGCLDFFGVPQKALTAVKVGDTRVSVAKYEVYYMRIYLNTYNTSYQYDSYYGTGYGAMYTGFDYTMTPEEQEYTLGTLDGYDSPTWADYFKETALEYVQSYVAYAELAREAGVTVTDEQQTDIDDAITDLTESAEDNDYSLDRYISKNYGKGANEKLLREVYEETYLAYNYATQKQEELTNAITTEQLEEEYNTNIQDYTTFSLRVFAVDAEETGLDDTATDEEVAAAESEKLAEAKTTADNLFAQITDADSVLTVAQTYNSELTSTNVEFTDTTASSVTSSFGEAVTNWVYEDGRAVGDKAVIEVDGGYVIAYVVSLPERDETKSVDVRHILVQFETETDDDGNEVELTDEEKATYYEETQSIYNEYLANPTEDNFASLAETYSDDTGSNTNGGLYEEVAEGDMVDEFNDWIFDPSRQSGDTDIIETEYGYHVMYYVGNDNEEAWAASCRTTLANTAFSDFDTGILEGEEYALDTKTIIVNWSARELEDMISTSIANQSLSS